MKKIFSANQVAHLLQTAVLKNLIFAGKEFLEMLSHDLTVI